MILFAKRTGYLLPTQGMISIVDFTKLMNENPKIWLAKEYSEWCKIHSEKYSIMVEQMNNGEIKFKNE
jgi:hypothetical protein